MLLQVGWSQRCWPRTWVLLPGQRDSMVSWNCLLLVQCCKCLLTQLQKRVICVMCVHECMQFAHKWPTSQCPLECLPAEDQRAWIFMRCSQPDLVGICILTVCAWICSYKMWHSFFYLHFSLHPFIFLGSRKGKSKTSQVGASNISAPSSSTLQ